MKSNMGMSDRAIRIVVALAIAGLYFTGTVTGTVATVLVVVAVVFFATSLVGTCPAYLPFGLSTKKES